MKKVLLFALLLSAVELTQAMDIPPRKSAPHAPIKKRQPRKHNNPTSKAKQLGSKVAELLESQGNPRLVYDEEIQQVIAQINTGLAFTQTPELPKQQ